MLTRNIETQRKLDHASPFGTFASRKICSHPAPPNAVSLVTIRRRRKTTPSSLPTSRKCVGGGGSKFTKLTAAEHAAVLTAMNKVGGADALLQITSQWLAAKPTTTKTVQAAVDECIEAKRKACRREHYLDTLRCSLDNFAHSVSKLVHEGTTRDVETWMPKVAALTPLVAVGDAVDSPPLRWPTTEPILAGQEGDRLHKACRVGTQSRWARFQ